MIEYSNLYDISVMLGEESIDYPGDTPYSRNLIWTIADSGICDLSRLELSAHSGTHIDTPAHFIAKGKTVDQYEIKNFILPASVVNVKNQTAVTADDIANVEVQPGDALLLRTENSASRLCCNGVFSETFVYVTQGAAEVCLEKEIALIGIDYITIEQYGNNAFDAHRALLGNGVLVLEGIDLYQVAAGRYTLFCLPLKMKSSEASPVRAFLMH